MFKTYEGLKSSCCQASVYGGYICYPDTAPTLFCKRCGQHDPKAEEEYDKIEKNWEKEFWKKAKEDTKKYYEEKEKRRKECY